MIDVKVGQMVYYISVHHPKPKFYCKISSFENGSVWGQWDMDIDKVKKGKVIRSLGFMSPERCFPVFNLPECFKKVIQ